LMCKSFSSTCRRR